MGHTPEAVGMAQEYPLLLAQVPASVGRQAPPE
jgi:hypothetical protein